MDVLKSQLLKLQQQLTGLNASQKMLTASLVAIMVMTILWWSRYAGTAEMVAVLDQTLSAADMGQVQRALAQNHIESKIVGDRIMVSADKKMDAVAALAISEALPSNITSAWDEIAKQMSPWDPTIKTESYMNRAKEQTLSAIITNYFPGVASANVVINPIAQRMIGGSREPSATVSIKTRAAAGEIDISRLASSSAAAVASAVSGLEPAKVTVIINGTRKKVQNQSDSLTGGELFEQIEGQEKHYSEEIEKLYPGSIVTIRVDLDNNSGQETNTKIDPVNTITKERLVKTQDDETTSPAQQPLEPGAQSNTGLTINSGPPSSGGANTTSNKSETENQVLVSSSLQTINKPGGKASVISAAVRIPRSYFVRAYKANNPNDTKEPDPNALQKIYKDELATIQKHVQNCVAMKSPENISIDMYYDDGILQMGDKIADAAVGSSVSMLLTGHAREIGVGMLAIVSLFMVSSIVKKSTPMPTILPEIAPKETPNLGAAEDIAGIVGDGTATLDAMEIDDDAIKSQQMVEQVSTMVKENPDAAANLVKRWLNRT